MVDPCALPARLPEACDCKRSLARCLADKIPHSHAFVTR